MKTTPAELEELVHFACMATWEPGIEEYRMHLAQLHTIIAESGALLEGNLFTHHLQQDLPTEPVDVFRNKRANYAVFVNGGDSLLEIGFNAGHSCLLALTMNKRLHYAGVDIGQHAYTRPCYEYLRSIFGGRVELYIGDSREVIPSLRRQQQRFDLYHLDGGHGHGVAHADLCNLLDFADEGSTLLVDDTDDNIIDGMCDLYVLQGQISHMKLDRIWSPTTAHKLFRVNRRRQTGFPAWR